MSNRALQIGDSVVIRPEAVPELNREGYVGVPVHEPTTITDAWTIDGRRCFELEAISDYREFDKPIRIAVWPSQVRLANGRPERLYAREVKLAVEIEAMKAERRAKRGRNSASCVPTRRRDFFEDAK